MKGDLPAKALKDAVAKMKAALAEAPKDIATRTASERALEVLIPAVPEMVGGSADLTGSNNTRIKDMVAISANNYGGRYVNYGIREHGMAAAMNGMALHGGIIPYSGTFLVFSDYLRPSLRLAALMGERVIHVLTHDSIGLGEDGPTHQPVEHVAALRAIPNLNVFRPCDTVETLECWQLALEAKDRPSVLALTRQNLPQLRRSNDADNKCAAGAYEISKADGEAKVSIFASGSEVSLAVEAQKLLAEGFNPRNTWLAGLRDTTDWLISDGRAGTDPACYDAHAPIPFDRQLLADALNRYPTDQRLCYPQLYPIAGTGSIGQGGNVKVRTDTELADKLAYGMPYLSSGDDAFTTGAVGRHIRQLFPEPCKYERS